MPRPLKHHELWRRLHAHDREFVKWENRGKGSHYMLHHPNIGGRAVSVPVPSHGGREISVRILAQIIRRFELPRKFFD